MRSRSRISFSICVAALARGEQLGDRHDQRRVADDAGLAVDEVGQLLEGVHAVLRARLGDVRPRTSSAASDRLRQRTPPAPARSRGPSTRRRGCASRRSRPSPRGTCATVASTAVSRSFFEKPLSRPAISKLAARRFTSHSQGPGAVSSKSLMSNTRFRSGEPNTPKFERCASPHSWVRMPEFGVRERSVAMISAPPR